MFSSFPRCFGPKENEPLDPNASESAFKILREQIIAETGNGITLDDMVRSSRKCRRGSEFVR